MSEQVTGFQLTSFQLKVIAIITMLIDHIGIVFFPEHLVFRMIGRISFPIFAFLLAEGFCHTSNVRKYMLRILVLAFVSEVPFDMIFYGRFLDLQHQNIFFTLFLAMLALYLYETLWYTPARWGSLFLILFLSEILRTDYSYVGILMVFAFYLFRERKLWKYVSVAFLNVVAFGGIQGWALLALIPIHFYKGERGRRMKYFFYAFYPVHLLLLFVIRILV